MAANGRPLQARIAYEDDYVNPLILEALATTVREDSLKFAQELPHNANQEQPHVLEWAAYETLDFDRALAASPGTVLVNAYVIRKALIRKHFLSQVIATWCTKHPDSLLKRHFEPATELELDYAEFLDDALVEAWDLRASFERNDGKPVASREWWILKPGMSDRGQGIRLFSTEAELAAIFEQWEAENDSDAEDDEDDAATSDNGRQPSAGEGIMTSQLRHFLAQPYIHPPILIPEVPFNNRKFHIRTYVVAHGAIKVWVYKHMLALFASEPYAPPWELAGADDEHEQNAGSEELLQKMRNVHLTNTCVQTDSPAFATGSNDTQDSVHLFADLPLPEQTLATATDQIRTTTAELFRAALAHPTHFQALPNSFEVFGLDFLLSADDDGVRASLLEVNAFPDFAQTGARLRDMVVRGLVEAVAREVIAPHFGITPLANKSKEEHGLHEVLDLDMGRR